MIKKYKSIVNSLSSKIIISSIILFSLCAIQLYIVGKPSINDHPSMVVSKFYRAMIDRDFETALRLLSSSNDMSDNDIDYAATVLSKTVMSKPDGKLPKNVKILKETVMGNSASVRVLVTFNNGKKETQTIQLSKNKYNNWKIENNPLE